VRTRIRVIVACVATVMTLLVPGTAATATTAPPPPEGGRAIYASNGVRCALGFNVVKSGTYYFLTAGGCAQVGLRIYADPNLATPLGTVVGVTAAPEIALVQYVDPKKERPGSVHTYPGTRDITTAGPPAVGQRICRSGPVNGLVCGPVTATNLTINLPDGVITGVARATVCAGELAGAPYFADSRAVGLEIGMSGNCASGSSSYFLPINSVLSAFGVAVY
jgi:streptogrisin B